MLCDDVHSVLNMYHVSLVVYARVVYVHVGMQREQAVKVAEFVGISEDYTDAVRPYTQ